MKRWWRGLSRVLWMVGLLLIAIWRAPLLLKEPRLWAEEGTKYFTTAFNQGFWQGVFAQHGGYYALIPNTATALATLLPLESAPLLTTLVALAVQLAVCSIVVFGLSPLFSTWPKKIFLSLAVLYLGRGEVWLTTVGSQYWLVIATFFLLLEPKEQLGNIRKWWYRFLLAVSGLTCVISSFLLPCLILKALRTKVKEEWTHVFILGSVSVFQLAVLFMSIGHEKQFQHRFGGNEFSLAILIKQHFVLPFIGGQVFQTETFSLLNDWFQRNLSIFTSGGMPAAELFLSVLYVGLFLVLIWKSRRNFTQQLIVLSFFLVVILSTLLSLRMASGPRYAFAPSVMVATFYISLLTSDILSRVCKMTVIIFLCVFAFTGYREYRGSVYDSRTWPNWKEEVQQWEKYNHWNRVIFIWPQFKSNSWYIELRPKNGQ